MAVGEDRCSTGSVGVQYAFDPEWNQKKCSTITVSASTVSSPVCTGYVCAFSCMERRFGFIGTGGVDQTKALAWIPVVQYVEDHAEYGSSLEDEETIAKILESQANDENAVDENGKLIGQPDEPQQPVSSEVAADQSIDKLRDFEYL